jgi:NAD(P)-dependent dehydrogenase (short-subunit alcohol dehydrogenase family)
MNSLEDKVIVFTRVLTNIDEAICKKFALKGAHILICNPLNINSKKNIVQEIISRGGTAAYYKKDITVKENAMECINQAISIWGRLDVLVANGISLPEEGYIPGDSLLTSKNYIKNISMIVKYAIPELQKTKGCIISSGPGYGPMKNIENISAYAFTKTLAEENAPNGIRVNYICHDTIDLNQAQGDVSDMSINMENFFVMATPGGRRGTPEEVANIYSWLVSEEASVASGRFYSVGWNRFNEQKTQPRSA